MQQLMRSAYGGSNGKEETKAERQARVLKVLEALDREYGRSYVCYLNHENPWQLLIAVILSAQCTDARVNMVTPDLFRKYDSPKKFAKADLKELEKDIHSLGFYHMKAKTSYPAARIWWKNLGARFRGQ